MAAKRDKRDKVEVIGLLHEAGIVTYTHSFPRVMVLSGKHAACAILVEAHDRNDGEGMRRRIFDALVGHGYLIRTYHDELYPDRFVIVSVE